MSSAGFSKTVNFLSGFVDVWSNVDEGVDAIYTVTLRHARGRNCQISSVDLQEMDSSVYLSVSGGHCLDIHTVSSDGQGQLQSTVVSDYMVTLFLLFSFIFQNIFAYLL